MNQISLMHAACREGPDCSLQSSKYYWLKYNRLEVTYFQDTSCLTPSQNYDPLMFYQDSKCHFIYLPVTPPCRDNCPSHDFLTHQKGSLSSSSWVDHILYSILITEKVRNTSFSQPPHLLTNFLFRLLMSNSLLIKICSFKPKMSSDTLSFYVLFSGRIVISYYFIFIFMLVSVLSPTTLS